MRRFSALSLITLLALALSACGSSAPTTGTDATSATGAAPTTAVDATTTGAEATTTTDMDATTTGVDATTTTGAEATTTTDMDATTVATADATTSTSGAATATPAAGATTADDLIAAATANGNLTTLVTALQTAGLEEQLQGVGPYTLFAPTDQAFAALPSGVLTALLADPTLLGSILSYHVAQGQLTAADVATATSIPTLQGQAITVATDGTTVTLNGDAKITTTDIVTSNGVIHVIDKVLIPSDVTLPAGS
jgi:transforming growth factor-beta-induced protein